MEENRTFWSWFATMKETRLRKYTSKDERVNDSTWIKDSRENFDCEHRPFPIIIYKTDCHGAPFFEP